MRRCASWIIPFIGVLALCAAGAAGSGAAHPARSLHGPTFVFPTEGQTLPAGGNYLFQVEAVPGAVGYL